MNAIAKIPKYIHDYLDIGRIVISIVLYFSKTFTRVDHEVLFNEMNVFRVRQVELI